MEEERTRKDLSKELVLCDGVEYKYQLGYSWVGTGFLLGGTS